MKISVFILDDKPFITELMQQFVEETDCLEFAGCSNNSNEVKQMLLSGTFHADLIYLDISMPEINGIELASLLRNKAMIVFITGYNRKASEIFDIGAIDYLQKPITYERFLQSVNKAKKLSENEHTHIHSSNTILVPGNGKMGFHNIRKNEISYIKGDGNYSHIHFEKGDKYITRMQIGEMENNLHPPDFIRISRSVIVNWSNVRDFYANYLVMANNEELSVGVNYKDMYWKLLTGK